MLLPTATQVLVVGAGPNGLTCAITLATLGIKATVVDDRSERSYGARGCLIHARTLEVLRTLGLSDKLKDIGIQSKGIVFYGQADPLFNVDIAALSDTTEFPYILLTPQSEAERIFEEFLFDHGVEVIRNTKVVGFQESSAEGLDVSFEDGSSILASYVVGADGARSTVRTLAGISFKDPSTSVMYDENPSSASFMLFALADVVLDINPSIEIPRDIISWHLNGRIMFCPLELPQALQHLHTHNTSFWRIAIAIPPGSTTIPPRHPDQAYLQNEIDERKPWKDYIRLDHLYTAATYRVRSAVAETFFKRVGSGKVLLVGDSAHVHSPSGGQGMNLGICDAVILGRAIAEHIDRGDDAILSDYSWKRTETARQVIQATKRMTAIINIPNGWRRWITSILMCVANWVAPIRRKIARRLSGITYRSG
ncbi:FAD/NAD(P)-binding domain-containing protein [Lentinula aciculospora]|uniref:FAD/NAD(P)-binding domain-containing protein n=1 Tax=Lentinula aciculospora TaxID=153920 RepID=A0A9W9A405_9AGAR|nr:FAD/NAD(P)-binding domain-containing protein [Lentinula aciculospora]